MNERADKPKRQLYFYMAIKTETSALSGKTTFQSHSMLPGHLWGAGSPGKCTGVCYSAPQSEQNIGNLQLLCEC